MSIHEVRIPFENDQVFCNHDGKWGYINLTLEVTKWLEENTNSRGWGELSYSETVLTVNNRTFNGPQLGAVFQFVCEKQAILFKLTWA